MTTNENAAAVRIRAFLDSRHGQTDRFAGTDDAPLTLSDLTAVLDQLDKVRVQTITDVFRYLREIGTDDLEGSTLAIGPSDGDVVWVHTAAQVAAWLEHEESMALKAAGVMAGREVAR